MLINDATPKGLIFELSALHDYGYSQTCFFDIFSKRVFGFIAKKSIAFSF